MSNGCVPFSEDEVLQNLQPQATVEAQLQAISYLTNLKSAHNFWQLAARVLLGDKTYHDHTVFFLWQCIEEHVKEQLPSDEDRRIIQEFIGLWIIQQGSSLNDVSRCIRNKAAKVFSLVFLRDYLTTWHTFFTDLTKPWSYGVNGIDNFLRVLKTIGIELADKDLVRSQIEFDRNTEIKNRMRETSIPQLADMWFEILTTKEFPPAIHCQCLEVVALYISWIDIGLIATERFMTLFVNLWKNPRTKKAVIVCVNCMVNKGMPPLLKVDLICGIVRLFHAEKLLEPPQCDLSGFSLSLAELVNSIGINLMDAHSSNAPVDKHLICNEIEREVPYMLAYLGNYNDDVSVAVLEFAKAYVRFLRSKMPMLTEDQQNHVHVLLHTIVKKMKYSQYYNFDQSGEKEEYFIELRLHLKGLLDNLASLIPDTLMEFTYKTVQQALHTWSTHPFQDVEVAITLLYYVGELSGGNHFTGNTTKVSRIQEMMRMLVTCGVSGHSNAVVVLQYMETIVRYEKFFLVEPEHIPRLLATFLDQRGMLHGDRKVRSRCAFLFTKFIKGLRNQIQPFAGDLLFPVKHSLIDVQRWISHDDQLYLYEAAGILIVSSTSSGTEKAATFHELLRPVCDKFNLMLQELRTQSNKERQEKLKEQMCHSIAVTIRASKAFPNLSTMKLFFCEQIFLESLQTFLPCLTVTCDITALQSAIRQFLHRMVVCLEELIFPYLSDASQGLLRDNTIQSTLEYLPLIIQIVSKFKKPMSQYMMQMFMPIVSAVFTALAVPIEVNDEHAKREKQLLHRNYFTFIAVIVNEMVEVLNGQKVEAVEHVTSSIIQGAVDFPDPIGQKTCFTILRKLVIICGGSNAPDEFITFTIKHIVPACFMAPLKPSFDLSDSQTLVTLGEVAACMLTVYEKQGEEFLKYLEEQYMPTLHITPELIGKYCNALRTKDKKHFKSFIKIFFQQIRT